MSTDLAKLVATLELQSAQYVSELDKANRKLDKFAKDTRRSFGLIDSAAAKLGSAMRVLGGTMLAAFGAGAIARNITAAAQFGDEIQKAAQRAGVAASTMSQFAAVGKQLDVSLEGLSKSFREMQVSISRASTGADAEVRLFKALGLEIKAFKALKPDQQLLLVIDQLQKFKDPADAARVGTELFGKSWAELAPLIAKGSDEIRNLIDEQERLGNTFNDEQLARMADADDAIKRLDASWTRFWRTLTEKVSPALVGILDTLSGAEKGSQWALMQQSAKLAADIKHASSIGDSYRVEKLTAERIKIEKLLLDFSKGPSGRRSGGGSIATGVNASALAAPGKATAPITTSWSQYQGSYLQILSGEDMENTRFDQFGEQLEQMFAEIPEWVKDSTDQMSVYADQAARNMQDAFAEFLFDPFEGGVKGMLKSFTDALRQMIAQQAAAGIFNWLGGKSGAGGVVGAVGSFFAGARADGGPVSAGKSYLVGESGPEMFTPGSSGHITPNGGRAVVIHNSPVINVNASQLTQDQAARMVADSQRRMWDELDRRYGLA